MLICGENNITSERNPKPMLNEQTFDKLYTLKLLGMAEGFKEQLEQTVGDGRNGRKTIRGGSVQSRMKAQ
jgi:hypothetical protein